VDLDFISAIACDLASILSNNAEMTNRHKSQSPSHGHICFSAVRFLEFQEFHPTKHVLQVCPMEEVTRPCLTLIFISLNSYGSLCQRDSVPVSVIWLNRWNCSDLQLLLDIQSLKLILTLQKTKSSTSFLMKSIQPTIFRDPGTSNASIQAIFIRALLYI